MIIRSKFTIKDGKNVGNLLTNFFKDFHKESMLSIKGRQVEMKISFETEPPMQVLKSIQALCSEDLEFYYGETTSNSDITHVPTEHDKPEVSIEHAESSEQSEEVKQTQLDSSESSVEERKEVSSKGTSVSSSMLHPRVIQPSKTERKILLEKLAEIICDTSSKEEAASAITNWFCKGKHKEDFEICVLASLETENFTTKSLSDALAKHGITLSRSLTLFIHRNIKKVSAYLGIHVSVLPFMELLKEAIMIKFPPESESSASEEDEDVHKTKNSEDNLDESDNSSESPISDESRTVNDSESDIAKEIKSLDPLEEMLNNLDKYSSASDCVQHIASELDFASIPLKERTVVLSVINATLQISELNDYAIIKKASISSDDYSFARMHISSRVSSFYERNGFHKKMKVLDFLKLLRDSILTPEELEKLS